MLANHKGEIPFFMLIIPFLLGIAVGFNYQHGEYFNYIVTVFILLSVLFISLNLTYSKLNLYKHRWIGGSLIFIILLLVGWVSVFKYNELNSNIHFSKITKAQYLVVKVNNEPIVKNGLVRFAVNTEKAVTNNKQTSVTGTLLIAIKDSLAQGIYYGDELIIPAKYNPIEPPYNPGEFNYKKYLANQNIYYQSFLYPKQYVVIAHNTGNALIGYSLRLRQRLVAKLKSNMQDTSAIAVASTLILGYKADLSNDVLQAYSKTGTVHVLSVSGAHVAIIFMLLNILLGFLNRYRYGKVIKAVLIITLIWYYSLLTGFSPAVCRAAVMISMVIIGKTFSRYINTLNILAISAFALLLYDPLFIADVGFQLSYLAVMGLIVFQPIVYKWLTFENSYADKLWALCSVSIAAQVITFPLSAFYFHQFPVYFLVSNLFIIIPVEIIMYVGILFLSLPQIPVVSKALAIILEKSILIMNKVLAIIEHAPFAGISKIWLNTFEYLLAYLIIICIFYFLYDKKKWLFKAGLIATLLLAISISIKRVNAANTSQIAMLNLGKHQGLVFKDGNTAVVFSDLKADDKNFQYAVQSYLDSTKVINADILSVKDSISIPFIVKKSNLIQFKNKLILIYDKRQANYIVSQKLKVDYVYVTGSPHTAIAVINKYYDYQTLVIDGSNSAYLIKNLISQAQTLHVNYRLLKRNKSLVVTSN